MADRRFFSTAILYQNEDNTIALLDIPQSISLAQGTHDHICADQIYSSQPLRTPYPSTEPKSEKAKANVRGTKVPPNADVEFPKGLLDQSLEEIAIHWKGEWCLMRKMSPVATARYNRKRKLSEDIHPMSSPEPQDPSHESHNLLPVLSGSVAENSAMHNLKTEPNLRVPEEIQHRRMMPEPLLLSTDCISGVYECSDVRHIANRVVHNHCLTPVSLFHAGTSYTVPPNASFMMSKINEATAPVFSMGALSMYPEQSPTAGPGQFDFILLDPPWHNRSVRRSAEYDTMRVTDPMAVLRCILGQHIAREGLLACWITNNSGVRDAAVDAFEVWGVKVIEEWAWLKTTVLGTPVTRIEGLWRKPYEVLLLGRRMDGCETQPMNPRKRVIVAVPDLHSRKPNLKALVEPMMPPSYRALEVFGRNLSAGWWVWGDEALKFNWEGHWSKG